MTLCSSNIRTHTSPAALPVDVKFKDGPAVVDRISVSMSVTQESRVVKLMYHRTQKVTRGGLAGCGTVSMPEVGGLELEVGCCLFTLLWRIGTLLRRIPASFMNSFLFFAVLPARLSHLQCNSSVQPLLPSCISAHWLRPHLLASRIWPGQDCDEDQLKTGVWLT